MTKLPNFLIVGAAKSGTTSLHFYLKEHPEIYLPKLRKETFFLVDHKNILGEGPRNIGKNIIKNLDEYQRMFLGSEKYKAIGEACVAYLYFYKNTIPNIIRYLDNPKIIIILRNPIERAFSNYLYHVKVGFEDLNFEEALEAQEKRKDDNWWWGFQIIDPGLYYNQVKAYLESFTHVKIFLYDDLKEKPVDLLKAIFEFLEVDISFSPDLSKRYNVSGAPKLKLLHNILTKPNILKNMAKPLINFLIPEEKYRILIDGIKNRNLKKPSMKPDTKKYLKRIYHDDIFNLQDLINRDLSHWMK